MEDCSTKQGHNGKRPPFELDPPPDFTVGDIINIFFHELFALNQLILVKGGSSEDTSIPNHIVLHTLKPTH